MPELKDEYGSVVLAHAPHMARGALLHYHQTTEGRAVAGRFMAAVRGLVATAVEMTADDERDPCDIIELATMSLKQIGKEKEDGDDSQA